MADRLMPFDTTRTAPQIARTASALSSGCQPFVLGPNDAKRLEQFVETSLPLRKGTHLFHQGDPFLSIFTVRAGTLKTYTVTNEGEEQITGFYFPGELVALGSIGSEKHIVSAKTLETTTVFEFPYAQLNELGNQIPDLQQQLINYLANEIRNEQEMMLLLSKKTAEQRVATFLFKLSERFRLRGYSATVFRLSMSRNEIGNYLGLAVETVSRIFTRFQKQYLIKVEGKEIEILSLDALYRVTGDSDASEEEAAAHF